MIEFRYDTQLLIEGHDLDEDVISDYFTENFKGDCLLAVGDDELIKIHFHTNEPWKVLEYCASLGEIYDIVVEHRQGDPAGPYPALHRRRRGARRRAGARRAVSGDRQIREITARVYLKTSNVTGSEEFSR